MKKKDGKLTNFQAPRDPAEAKYDVYKNAKPIDMKSYQNMGQVEHHKSTESVVEKMISKAEAKSGIKIDQAEEKEKYNLNGINDNRDKKYWSPK